MQKVDLILQGPYDNYACEIAESYKQLPWVGQIIISCWNDDPETICGDKTVRSLPLSNNGIGNRNAQIVTSRKGLLETRSDFCAKLRSDQKISLDSMNKMYAYMIDRPDKICVAGFYRPFPFHPRDHMFWGLTHEVAELFDIPLDKNTHHISNPPDSWPNPGFYAAKTRAECYIVSQYLAKKNDHVKRMVENPQIFLYDFSPQWEDAKRLSDELMPKYFAPFPKIDFEWPKHNMTSYDYDGCARLYGEYWGEG